MATSVAQEDINFLRLAGLLIKIAPRAVRRKFDYEFHPTQLQNFLSQNQHTIHELTYKKRVITLPQYELLYSKGSTGVSSDMFDVTLMVCLLRHFIDLDIQNSLPLDTNLTMGADISRIRFYRNYIVHSDSGKVTGNKFSEIWICVAEAILRLEPDLKPEIDALMSLLITNDSDIIDFLRLEKDMENTNQHLSTVSQKLSTVSQQLETLEVETHNTREIHNKTMTRWREIDQKYFSTSATTFILQSLNKNRDIIITGSPGCGKSVAAHHVALKFEMEGYEIIPCDNPTDIIKHFTAEKIQVFVIDDVCGKFALNQHKADSWEQNDDKLSMLFKPCTRNGDNEDIFTKSKTKFIMTCRENIYSHKAFPNLTCFSHVQCSFSTTYKISPEEMRNIALSYVSEDIVNDIQNLCLYDFFPLICGLYCKKENRDPVFFTHPVEIIENEISVMKIKSESSFLCLSLLVLKNNIISKDDLRSGDVDHLVKSVCSDCDIELVVSMVTLQNCFERLKGIYIIEEGEIYTAIHDKMFDIIAAAIAPSIMKSLITYAEIAFLANRIQLLSLGRSSLPFAVHIPQEFERVYLKRIHKEAMSGKYWEVFGGIQTENEAYRKVLLSYLKEQNTGKQTSYITGDDGPTPLFVSSSLGYLEFVKYFISKCPNHINFKDKEGKSSFYVACKNGHIAVVKYLMKYYEDINAETVYKTTALSAACYYGHNEVAKLLIDNNANINRTNKCNQTALNLANQNVNVQLGSLLLSAYNTDLTIRDNDQTTLLAACKKGHTQTFKQERNFCIDVYQQSDLGWTPLFFACVKGHYETVKLLLDSNEQTLENCVETTIKDNTGCSILHAACENGHTEVVKLLIERGMNVNDTTPTGYTSFFVACLSGRYEVVKYLLALNGQQLNSRVDTTIKTMKGWSALHASCSEGHTEVVKLLIDVDLNVNDRTHDFYTPLGLACFHGHYDIVKYFLGENGKTLDNSVDITIKIQKGWSVLHAACVNGNIEIVKELIDVGCNLNETNDDRVTPLYLACIRGHYDTVKFLIAYATIKYEYGWSSLQGACIKGHTEIVKLLVEFGMNLNVTLKARRTPLYLACEHGHYNTVKFLLDLNVKKLNCVDTTIKHGDGGSILHIACLNGHTEVVKLLIDVGLKVNDTTDKGYTPLYLACQNGHYDIVKYLLDLNEGILNSLVDTTIKDSHGHSAFYTAKTNKHTDVVRLLTDAGMNEAEQRSTIHAIHAIKDYCFIQ